MRIEPQFWSCRIDQIQFETAQLANLAVNARDAMPDGGEFVDKNSGGDGRRRRSPRDFTADIPAWDYVRLSVSDTGIGMDQEVLDHAFEPFFTTKDVGKGSGLGLSQVHSFVTSAQGHIRVESAPGKGTTFHLYLPRSTQEELAGSGRVRSPIVPSAAVAEPSSSSRTISVFWKSR